MSFPLGYVLLERFSKPDLRAVVEAIRQRMPSISVRLLGKDTEADEGSDQFFVVCEDQIIDVLPIEAPLPPDEALPIRAALAWPEAPAAFAGHKAHLIVSGPNNIHRLQGVRVTTAVIGGLLDCMPECIGVVWLGLVARPASLWREAWPYAFAQYPNLPFKLWIEVFAFRDGEATGLITHGLSFFVGREIQFYGAVESLEAMQKEVFLFAMFLMERGSVVPDGAIIVGAQGTRFGVRYGVSKKFKNLPVLLLEESQGAYDGGQE
jgi:hypothetical protein